MTRLKPLLKQDLTYGGAVARIRVRLDLSDASHNILKPEDLEDVMRVNLEKDDGGKILKDG